MKTIGQYVLRLLLLVVILRELLVSTRTLLADDPCQAVGMARQYLEATEVPQRRSLSEKLAPFDADWRNVLDALLRRTPRNTLPGYYAKEPFSVPKLRTKHADDLLYFIVPKSYCPEHAAGLIVFMHGGGKGSPRTAPDRYMRPHNPTEAYIGDVFEEAGMIGVAPSAPWNENDHSRWTVPEADDYVADVILECKTRFNIDPDRVFLWGHSMGGFGAYHQVQRQPDRFAAVIASAGSWTLAQWPVIRGTTLCIVHGTRDAELGVRDRHTDIAYARSAHQLLAADDLPHIYIEHDGPHPVKYAKEHVLEFFRRQRDLRRDPYASHIVLASPVGYRDNKCFSLRHNRWLTLEATIDGPLTYDALQTNGRGASKDDSPEQWNQWELKHDVVQRTGAMIEAVNRGQNRLEITTTNVARFTVWLHAKMVDFDKPVHIVLNGRSCFNGLVTPSLTVALESFERRQDEGLVYPARITLDVLNQ